MWRDLQDRVYVWQMRRYYLKHPPFRTYLDLYPKHRAKK